jgi:hypothetical protein
MSILKNAAVFVVCMIVSRIICIPVLSLAWTMMMRSDESMFLTYVTFAGLLVPIVAMILYIVVEVGAKMDNLTLILKNILLLVGCFVVSFFIYQSVLYALDGFSSSGGGSEGVQIIFYILIPGSWLFISLIAIGLFILLRKTAFWRRYAGESKPKRLPNEK